MSDLIERQAAIDALDCINGTEEVLRSLPSAQPEPCKDAVSREAAIDVAENAFVRGLLASPDIRRLPSAQPEPQWIPCSERLPENDDAVLISHKHGVGKAWWNGRFWSSATKKCYKTVTAWMPLPTAYREDGGE